MLTSFIDLAERELQEEYRQLQSRRRTDVNGRSILEDPGTAGDQAEETWACLLRNWLPSYFTVVTKGQIILPNGEHTRQVDVIVLSPSYPRFLIEKCKKFYLASGVAAAFECKLTGQLTHIDKCFEFAEVLNSGVRAVAEPSPQSPYRIKWNPLRLTLPRLRWDISSYHVPASSADGRIKSPTNST